MQSSVVDIGTFTTLTGFQGADSGRGGEGKEEQGR